MAAKLHLFFNHKALVLRLHETLKNLEMNSSKCLAKNATKIQKGINTRVAVLYHVVFYKKMGIYC